MKYRYNISCVKKCIMSVSSIVIFSAICWWLWCVFSFALVSTNIEKGLFPHGAMKDIKDGSMSSLFSLIHKHSITLVFFYAPWSGQCIKLVPQIFSAYKRINSSLVTIAAINCWVGHCKEKFSTYHFPRLFLYHSSYSPIEYLDDIEADSIVNFLQLSVTPWEYVVNSQELHQFIENYDDYFVAYMDVNKLKDDKVYDVFHHSALLLINRSKRARIAILTNHTMAAMLQLKEHGEIRSHSLSPRNLYTTDLNYSADAISRWMNTQTKKIVRVLKPHPDKTSYVKMLKQGPAIILHSSQSAIESGLMQQYLNVALSYHDDCEKVLHNDAYNKRDMNGFCSTFLVNKNMCSVCQLCSTRTRCADGTHSYFKEMRYLSTYASQCSSASSESFHNDDKFSFCCLDIKGEHKWKTKVKSTLMTTFADIIPPGNTKRWGMLKQISVLLGYMQDCYMNVSRSIQHQSITSRHEEKNKLSLSLILNKFLDLNNEVKLSCGNSSCPTEHYLLRSFESLINGLACTTNRTLNFFILNYDRYRYLLRHIGLSHEPTLLIVDLMKEEHYTLQKEISLRSLSSFILQFTLGRLQQNYPIPTPANKTGDEVVSGRIVELTSLTFDEVVMTTMKHVLVMFYTLWCGICKVINLTFLQLVHSYDKEVIFTRIDADTHALPWQYQPNVYPSFILFPAHRKDHSVNFPSDRPVTLRNLQNFLDDNIPWE